LIITIGLTIKTDNAQNLILAAINPITQFLKSPFRIESSNDFFLKDVYLGKGIA